MAIQTKRHLDWEGQGCRKRQYQSFRGAVSAVCVQKFWILPYRTKPRVSDLQRSLPMAIIHCYKQHRQKNENSFCSYTVSGIRQKVIYYICTKNYSWPTEFGHSGKWKVVESRNDFLPSPLESFVPIVSKGFRNDWQFRICQLGKCLVDSRGQLSDFWGGYGWFQKKNILQADFDRKKACKEIPGKTISCTEKNITPLNVVEKKILTPEQGDPLLQRFRKKNYYLN